MDALIRSTYVLDGGNNLLRILICDDDINMLDKIKKGISRAMSVANINTKIHAFSNIEKISTQILESSDIALLDIDFQESGMNGMALAKKLRAVRKDAIIIFITNFIEYAPEGYEVQAFRYIMKNKLEKDMVPCVLQAVQHLQNSLEVFKIQIEGEIIDLVIDNILYFEVMQHFVTVHVQKDKLGKNLKTYEFYATLSALEKQLASKGFLRIHKSFLVNMKHLKKFQSKEAVLDNGTTLRVSEKSYAEKKQEYLIWKGF